LNFFSLDISSFDIAEDMKISVALLLKIFEIQLWLIVLCIMNGFMIAFGLYINKLTFVLVIVLILLNIDFD
jgi:hypothetical protein